MLETNIGSCLELSTQWTSSKNECCVLLLTRVDCNDRVLKWFNFIFVGLTAGLNG